MGLSELRRLESKRRLEEHQYRLALILSVAPISAAMALVVLYLIVPATFAERHVYSEITRPHTGEFIRSTWIIPIIGAVLGSLIAFLTTDLLGVPRSHSRLLITLLATGILFGLLIPVATAIALPINLFLVAAITSVEGVQTLVDDLLVAVFSTTGQLFLYWAQSLYIGVLSGSLVALVSFLSLFSMRSTGPTLNLRPALMSLCLAAMLVAVLIAGPFGLYEYLVRQLTGR